MITEDGKKCREDGEIAKEIAKHFESLFTTENPQECDEILEGIPRTITEAMNRKLTKAAKDQEIKKALFSMHPNKSSGPDGMPPSFFQYIGTL